MKRATVFTMVFIAIAFMPVWATVCIVDSTESIQECIDISIDGDTVLVQPGTYVENINFNGHNIVLGSLFLTTGDTSYISQTAIDGNSLGSVVLFTSGENSASIITGFTIQNGSAEIGGGIGCVQSSPTISNNTITGNSAGLFGGGIGCLESNPTISNNTISGNSARLGSGIGCIQSSSTISNNTITGNSAELFGGGIDCGGGWFSPTISNNTITGNSAQFGGGIHCYSSSSPTISNNTITGNSSESEAGGIACQESSPTISNNTISGNLANRIGGGMVCLSSDPSITNTIFWANSAPYDQEISSDMSSSLSINYCDIQDTLWPGDGNISVDPLFRDTANGDFHLMFTACGDTLDSPCIDAGSPAIIDTLLDCSWGLGTILSDMGAYGGGDSVTVGIDYPGIPFPEGFSISQNYPNPFNARTTIQYNLPMTSEVVIDIYDILGRKVETLVPGEQQAGYHQIVWDASDQSSGIYFYRIQAGEYVETRKMLFLK